MDAGLYHPGVDDPLRAIFTVGAALTLPAVGALLLGGALLLISLHREALATAIATAPLVGCGGLGAGAPTPKRVIVTGRVRPGAAGELVGPISGERCVWFRVEVWQNQGSRGPRARYQWDGGDHFAVRDATGEIRVAARLVDRHLHEPDINAGIAADLLEWTALPEGKHLDTIARLKAAGMPIRARRWGDYHRITEYRLPADRTITVLGRPQWTDGGAALTRTIGVCGVSDRTVDQLRVAARAAAADTRSLPRVLLYSGAALLAVSLLLRIPHWLAAAT